MVQVHRGVRGVVKDSAGEPVEGATVVVNQVDAAMIVNANMMMMIMVFIMTMVLESLLKEPLLSSIRFTINS